MSDLLAPIMVIMDNEVDSFWCFAGYMDKIVNNYFINVNVFKRQLMNSLKNIGVQFFDGSNANKTSIKQSKDLIRVCRFKVLTVFRKK